MIEVLKSFKSHNGFMKYFKNTSWLFAEKFFRIITALFIGIWVARYLGPEKYGIFSYAQSFVALFASISSLGLDSVLVKRLLKKKSKKGDILGTAFWLKLFGAFLTFTLITITLIFFNVNEDSYILIWILAIYPFFNSFNILDQYFQSVVKSRYAVYASISSLLINAILRILLINNGGEVIHFTFVIILDSFFAGFFLVIFFLRKYKFKFKLFKFNFKQGISLLKESWPLIIGSVAASIYMEVDKLMVEAILGAKQLGYYAVASKLSVMSFFVAVLINKSILPAILTSRNESYHLFTKRMQSLYNLLIKIAFFISVLICFFSDSIVNILYGSEFDVSSKILSIYIWSIVFVYMSNTSSSFYLAENILFHSSIRLILGGVLNVLLNIFLIEPFGLDGAAYATLISYGFASYFYNALFKQTRINFKMQTLSIINVFNIKSYKIKFNQ